MTNTGIMIISVVIMPLLLSWNNKYDTTFRPLGFFRCKQYKIATLITSIIILVLDRLSYSLHRLYSYVPSMCAGVVHQCDSGGLESGWGCCWTGEECWGILVHHHWRGGASGTHGPTCQCKYSVSLLIFTIANTIHIGIGSPGPLAAQQAISVTLKS